MLALRTPTTARTTPCMPSMVVAAPCVRVARAAGAASTRPAAVPTRSPLSIHPRRASVAARASAGNDDGEGNTTLQLVAGALGTPAALLVCYSAFLLATTGDGLPPGPGGLYGAAEGVSYLAVLGLVGWSVATKVRTGSGLPAGPAGLLGAAEGISYLALLGAIGAFAYTAATGTIPGPFGR